MNFEVLYPFQSSGLKNPSLPPESFLQSLVEQGIALQVSAIGMMHEDTNAGS